MNRPDNILAYDEMDLKLGIKSSLPHVKSTLALAILLWELLLHLPAVVGYVLPHMPDLLDQALVLPRQDLLPRGALNFRLIVTLH